MGLSITNFKLTQPVSPLNTGDSTLNMQLDGLVDRNNDNDVKVTATIVDQAPVTFKATGSRELKLTPLKFGVGQTSFLKEEIVVVLEKSSSGGESFMIKILFETANGKKRERFKLIEY